jgi:hypothetical protein
VGHVYQYAKVGTDVPDRVRRVTMVAIGSQEWDDRVKHATNRPHVRSLRVKGLEWSGCRRAKVDSLTEDRTPKTKD